MTKQTVPVFNLHPEKLENDLVKIIPLEEKDFERLFAVASDLLIWELHPIKDRYKREVFKMYFDGAVTSNSAFLVFDKTSNELIGSTRFHEYKPEHSSVVIGYTFLARKYWGGVHNKSMKKLLLDYAFNFVETVKFHVGTENIRSQKALLKIGAKKTTGDDFAQAGKILNFEYEIKKSEWKGL